MSTTGTVMASLTPAADLQLLGREYAAMRPASAEERKALKLRRRAIAYAVVLRSCAGVTVLVAEATGAKGRPMSADIIDSLVIHYSMNNETGAAIGKSAAVIAIARTLFSTSLLPLLLAERPSAGPCLGCRCIWQPAGAFDSAAERGRAVETIVGASIERRAA
ncbi:hypothetical protein [Jiella sonneratiae]|uniref:Uncharacterized protein n=1 Tax=Jiella sonneratiae TaxID=2816856 RepID=A0ABS3J2B1_9HYPH|nr:hypothetical protein [Jiella sonneratiae]MBO0903808.1 hypothetical protein [Jiella sonneratiae]